MIVEKTQQQDQAKILNKSFQFNADKFQSKSNIDICANNKKSTLKSNIFLQQLEIEKDKIIDTKVFFINLSINEKINDKFCEKFGSSIYSFTVELNKLKWT